MSIRSIGPPAYFAKAERFAQVLHTLDRLDLTDNTFVVATSDNGQHPSLSDAFGTRSQGPYRGGKFTAWEGGHRMFGLLRWPGRIVPGVSNRLTSHLDLLPTFAELAGAPLPARTLDGEDMGPWLFTRTNSTPAAARYKRRTHDRVLHIYNCKYSEFLATRVGKYKVWHKNDHNHPVHASVAKKSLDLLDGLLIHLFVVRPSKNKRP